MLSTFDDDVAACFGCTGFEILTLSQCCTFTPRNSPWGNLLKWSLQINAYTYVCVCVFVSILQQINCSDNSSVEGVLLF
jgi:hypothetical protein